MNAAHVQSAQDVKTSLNHQAEQFARFLFPQGHKEGHRWRVGDLQGKPGKSLAIDISGSAVGRWRDYATGENGTNLVELYLQARGVTFPEARDACGNWLGMAPVTAKLQELTKTQKKRRAFPAFNKGSAADFQRLAELRNLSVEGLQIASERGLLWFAPLKGHDAWIVTDGDRVNAQARRMDGGTWDHLSGSKAYTLPGSRAKWPIGARESQPFAVVALCEGGPDLLAAFHFAWCEDRGSDVAPVAILGAGNHIHEDALPLLAGKRVRMFPHLDEGGQAASKRWARQLTGAEVDYFDFSDLHKTNGEAVTDLNDCTSICADDFEANRELWRLLP